MGQLYTSPRRGMAALRLRNGLYIGSVLLERNRWTTREPSYRVSQWLGRFAQAGFDGVELWEYHATRCPPSELAALQTHAGTHQPPRLDLFNSYCEFTDDPAAAARRQQTCDLARRLGARAVKFNVGRDATRCNEYMRNLNAWVDSLPEGCRPLCECHPGTVVETAEAAERFFDALGRERFDLITHPLIPDLNLTRQWLQRFGPAITHAHLQMRDEERTIIRLDRRPEHFRAALDVLREAHFPQHGSMTLEFTEGARAATQNIDELWANCLLDLDHIRRTCNQS